MAEQIYSESIRKAIENKKQIESSLKVKLNIKGHIVTITGDPADELICLRVIEAMNLGFSVFQALDLKDEQFAFEVIPIKNIAKRRNLSQVRGRIIGTERKTLRTIEALTGCEIVLHDNSVGVIGLSEAVRKASYAMRKLIAGSKHANVYMYLEDENAKQKAGVW